MFKSIIILISIIVVVYINYNVKITFKPFTFQIDPWYSIIGVFLITIGIYLMVLEERKKSMIRCADMAIELIRNKFHLIPKENKEKKKESFEEKIQKKIDEKNCDS